MRGDDRSSRYPPRGVWFGLILAVGTVRASVGAGRARRDDAAPTRRPSRSCWPPTAVTHWSAPDGHLGPAPGDSSVLQGVDGVRARRPSSGSSTSRPAREDLAGRSLRRGRGPRCRGTTSAPRSAFRAVFRTTEVHLKCYDPAGADSARKIRPGDLAIIRRSGFLAPKSGEPSQRQPPSRSRVSATAAGQSGLPVRLRPNAIVVQPRGGRMSRRCRPAGKPGVRCGATSARHPRSTPMIERCRSPELPRPWRRPSRRSRLRRRIRRSAGDSRAGSRWRVKPPVIDLPPIEGAPRFRSRSSRSNPEDLPPNIQPLPGADGPIPSPRCRGSRPRARCRCRQSPAASASRRADHARQPARHELFPRSGRKLEMQEAADDPGRRRDLDLSAEESTSSPVIPSSARSTSRPTRP